MKWIFQYERSNSDILTGPYIGVIFEQKSLAPHVYVLCPIYLDLSIEPNYHGELY